MEGRKKVITYILEKDSLEIKKLTITIATNSKTYDLETEEIAYDADRPEMMTKLIDLSKEYKDAKPIEGKTIKVIYNAGTDKEEVYNIEKREAFSTLIMLREGYAPYKGPNGKEPLTTAPEPGMTMYAFKK